MVVRRIKYLRCLVLIVCILISNSLKAENLIRTEGVALITSTLDKSIYRTRAIENALQNLASQGVQTLDSFSIVENGKVLLDQVHLASKLGIQQYSVIKEEVKGRSYHVTLNVVVSNEQSKKQNNLCRKAAPPSLDYSIVFEKKLNKMPAWVLFSDDFINKALATHQFEPKLQKPSPHTDQQIQAASLYSLFEKDTVGQPPVNLYKLHTRVVLEPSHNVNLVEKKLGLKITIFSHVMRKDKKILEQIKQEHFTIEQKNLNGLFSPVTRRDWPLIKDKMANFILETIEQQLSQLNCLKFLPKIQAKSGKIVLDYGSYDGVTSSDMFMLKNGNAKKIYFRLESLDKHETTIKIVSKVESLEALVGSTVELVSGS